MSLSKLREIVNDREAWCVAVPAYSTEQLTLSLPYTHTHIDTHTHTHTMYFKQSGILAG